MNFITERLYIHNYKRNPGSSMDWNLFSCLGSDYMWSRTVYSGEAFFLILEEILEVIIFFI